MKVNSPSERSIRLASGLFMFSFAACHFLSHATGLLLLDNMEHIGRRILLAPWRNTPMRVALLICFVTHGGLGLRALYRRRHLRMPAIEAVQLGLGLVIPVLLIPHALDVRLGYSLFGFDDSYYRVVYKYWLTAPLTGLPRQFALLLAIWIHGCIGIHMWLRFRPGYLRWRAPLLIVATLIPTLATMGVNNAGWDAALRARTDASFRTQHGPPPAGSEHAIEGAALADLLLSLQIGWIALVAAVALARAIRDSRARRWQGVTIAYSSGPTVRVPRGYSILEASRSISFPHESACGGRARCSTCRVRIHHGLADLPSPSLIERSTLARVGAPENVRLACQVRPASDVGLAVLLAPARPNRGLRVDLGASRELTVTAVYVDLRDSTGLASTKLPFDAIFFMDRYIQAVTAAVHSNGGSVTSVAGDGVMSVFGIGADAGGSRNALAAAEAIWRSLDRLGADFAEELSGGLRFGIGVHTGLSVVGTVGLPGERSVQFLGDTGNVAAKLEGLTKETKCTMIVSAATVAAAGISIPDWRRADLAIPGKVDPAPAYLIFDRGGLASLAFIAN